MSNNRRGTAGGQADCAACQLATPEVEATRFLAASLCRTINDLRISTAGACRDRCRANGPYSRRVRQRAVGFEFGVETSERERWQFPDFGVLRGDDQFEAF